MSLLDPKDGGFKSRKMWMTVFAIAVLFVGGLALPVVVYSEFVTGVIGALLGFTGGNVMSKFALARAGRKAKKVKPPKKDDGVTEEGG